MRGLYVWILIAKVAIVLVLLPIAYRLRHRIFIARETALPSTDLRNPLTGELFLAALILFASTLLSQQSPP